jgi:hypothetical protein
MKIGDLVIDRFLRTDGMGVIVAKNPQMDSYRVLWFKNNMENWMPYLALEKVKKCP